jgi:DNA replication and repair protein RecF
MITHLKLKNFRKFKDLQLEFNSNIVVLHGDNAQGKSSILEALHIIANGNSPWSGSDEYVYNNQNGINKHSRIEITIDGKTYSHYKDNNRKVYMIDNHKTTPKKFYSENIATIFNPEKIDLLMLSPSRRRDFLDETISHINYEYPSILKRFKKVLRQRNSYLKKLSKQFYEKGIIARNDPQLNFWSKEFIQLSAQIYIGRISMIKNFEKDDFKLEYSFCNKGLDKILKITDIKKIEEILTPVIEDGKKRDIASGYTNVGPHRDDWSIFTNQDIKKYGSRGQKRVAIGNLIFKAHEIIAKKIGYFPTLLLDDIASELDEENTEEMFDIEFLNKQQTFITTVSPKVLPKEIANKAQLLNLNEL